MHLGTKISRLGLMGRNPMPVNAVEERQVGPVPLPARQYVVGWLWFEDGGDHWSVLWGVGEDKEQARIGQVTRIDVSKATGSRFIPAIAGEDHGVTCYGKIRRRFRFTVHPPECEAATYFEMVGGRIEQAYQQYCAKAVAA